MTRLLFTLPLLFSLALSISPGDYGRGFSGDGTYYGGTESGNCALRQPRPPMYSNLVPVALNLAQYGDSGACGACIEFSGSGVGSGANPITGTRTGYIMDKCPECAPGDIDLGIGGDGRWQVSWKFVPCPGNSLSFLFEGSNTFYGKIQPRGLTTPAKSMTLDGLPGSRTDDNFFIFQNGGGFQLPVRVTVVTVMGKVVTATLRQWPSDGVVYPASQTNTGGFGIPAPRLAPALAPVPVSAPAPAVVPAGRGCVAKWRACAKGGKGCCDGWVCERAKQPGFNGNRCVPVNRPAFFAARRRGGGN